jgi:sugar/nucleoside kinase (ribokinase family)
VCLDIIPGFGAGGGGIEGLRPGSLTGVGPAILAGGGPVSNAGLALHRLGLPVALMGKVGADPLGRLLLDVFRRRGEELAAGMIVVPGEDTSYTIVLSPPGTDRLFLHCPGANDTFGADDIDYAGLPRGGIFHFGYPPLMRRMYAAGGRELAEIFRRVKARGLATSLDLARPDPASPAGRADWASILRRPTWTCSCPASTRSSSCWTAPPSAAWSGPARQAGADSTAASCRAWGRGCWRWGPPP